MLRTVVSVIATILAVSAMTAAALTLSPDTAEAPGGSTHLTGSDEREVPVPTSATMTVVGDIMLGRDVETSVMQHGVAWPFAEVQHTWAESDYVVGNFESTIRDAYRYEGEVLAFDVTPEIAGAVRSAGFTHLSLANNHGDDFGSAVTAYTREVIAGFGITPFGDPSSSEAYVAHADATGFPIALVGFHAFLEDPADVARAVATEDAQGRFVIVVPHWGNEYQSYPSQAQRDAAAIFIAAGADLIIGAHPHVIQPIELVDPSTGSGRGGVPVAWSLGNFIFDQEWSQATQEGLMLHLTLTDTTVTIHAIPVTASPQATVMGNARAQEILEFIGIPEGTITFTRP